MRAAVCREFGPPESVSIEDDYPAPALAVGQVRVRVGAAAVKARKSGRGARVARPGAAAGTVPTPGLRENGAPIGAAPFAPHAPTVPYNPARESQPARRKARAPGHAGAVFEPPFALDF